MSQTLTELSVQEMCRQMLKNRIFLKVVKVRNKFIQLGRGLSTWPTSIVVVRSCSVALSFTAVKSAFL